MTLLRLVLSSFLLAGSVSGSAWAQERDTLGVRLPEVQVEAARGTLRESEAPVAVAVIERDAAARALEPALSLQSVLGEVPGLWLRERGNAALGERLTLRGVGWRSSFGVRGVAVMLDGIPLTFPDGQAILDPVEPALVERAEVIRGPAAFFGGNSSGGVVALSSGYVPSDRRVQLRLLGGSAGTGQVIVHGGTSSLSGFASHTRTSGFRDYAAGEMTRLGARSAFALNPRTSLFLTAHAAFLDAENPGALTREEFLYDPTGADPRQIAQRTGKRSAQGQAALMLRHDAPGQQLSATFYGVRRRLENPLTYAFIELARWNAGARLQLQVPGPRFAWSIGGDAATQRDTRSNRGNEAGKRGSLRLDQQETVGLLAAFGQGTLRLTDELLLLAGLRADLLRYTLTDSFLSDGDGSGARTFSALSPALGLSYRLGPTLVFANLTTAFETPTTTELVNQPDGSGGFNEQISSETTQGVELGVRRATGALRYEAALFTSRSRDRLTPFQEADGRTYFRNAGGHTAQGIEASVAWTASPLLEFRFAYTGQRLRFTDEALRGRTLPGLPTHHGRVGGLLTHRQLRAELSAVLNSSLFVDDANATRAAGSTVVDARIGWREVLFGALRLAPFVSVTNVLDAGYVSSVIVNAAGGRYYEPGAGRLVQVGVSVGL